MSPEILSALLTIIVIDLVVSGDNAVVIGMAAHRLLPHQRRIAILFGGGAAIVLRISLTAVATLLLTLPLLKAVGGLLLLYIAFKLLKTEEENLEGVKVAATLRGAIVTILIADFVMSLDNILAVAAAAHGDLPLLLFGLAFSMGILMLGGALAANLINRFWWLVYVGSGVIAWVGAEMIQGDPWVAQLVHLPDSAELVVAAVVTAITLGAAHYFHRHLPARRRAMVRMATGSEVASAHSDLSDGSPRS
jgi:YjbE family integral membrane protein